MNKITHMHTIPHYQTKRKLRVAIPAVRELPLSLSTPPQNTHTHTQSPSGTCKSSVTHPSQCTRCPPPKSRAVHCEAMGGLHWRQTESATALLVSWTAQMLPTQAALPAWCCVSEGTRKSVLGIADVLLSADFGLSCYSPLTPVTPSRPC